MGRPAKLTPELREAICRWVRLGNYIETAAHLAGVHKQTLYNWMKWGAKQKSGAYREFFDAIKRADAHSESQLVRIIGKAARQQWQAAAWRLERKYPQKWGRREQIEVKKPAKKQKRTASLRL